MAHCLLYTLAQLLVISPARLSLQKGTVNGDQRCWQMSNRTSYTSNLVALATMKGAAGEAGRRQAVAVRVHVKFNFLQ